ncbi:hypothetical protein Pan216_11320 [Planctomycetes bacterium Pan216]|uniref:Uncharacterized protein n=1 Tax=Kolteria novifilia TaxID=2527975 RepID=A0A518AZZ1_9BACT|nr:hypothetical protein Pan216_11320 [Planctomycetes bacterium Pan216]
MRNQVLTAQMPRGLTLIEALIATTLTLLIMAIFSTLFVAANKGVSDARGVADIDQKVRLALSTIRKDLEHVYLLNLDGEEMTPSDLFVDSNRIPNPTTPTTVPQPTNIPSAGYILIEENSPAAKYPDASGTWSSSSFTDNQLRQGVDSIGLPVEIDTDDVLAMTVKDEGVSPETFYWGKVFPAAAVLDDGSSPTASLDQLQSGNGLIASPFAEVVYFLRPDRTQYATTDINNPSAPPEIPATYTLYRRQLLALSETLVSNLDSVSGGRFNINTNSESYYENYDISVRWDGTRLRFNTPQTLAQRRNRFGMIPFGAASTALELPFVPSTTFYQNGIHSYGQNWFGRPTQKETTHSGFPQNPMSINLTDTTPTNGIADAYQDEFDTRQGEDILLTNVVSFDVKVFDDDFLLAGSDSTIDPTTDLSTNELDWPAVYTSANANTPPHSSVPNATIDAPTLTANSLQINPPSPYNASPLLRPDFIDLGYRGSGNGTTTNFEQLGYFLNPSGATLRTMGWHEAARWRTSGRGPVFNAGTAAQRNPVSTYDSWWQNNADGTTINWLDSGSANFRPPPYDRPLRGIQIKIRVWEPKSNIVREFTIVHSFLGST